jgi:hypothetical protein
MNGFNVFLNELSFYMTVNADSMVDMAEYYPSAITAV